MTDPGPCIGLTSKDVSIEHRGAEAPIGHPSAENDDMHRLVPPYKPYFFPAECFAGCEDVLCPYIHVSGWKVSGVDGLFITERAAQDFLDAMWGKSSAESGDRTAANEQKEVG